MGGGKTKVAGGGAARPVADQYSNFLGQFLAGNSVGQTQNVAGTLNSMLAGRPGDPSSLQQYFNAGMGGTGQAPITSTQAQYNPAQFQNFNLTQPNVNANLGVADTNIAPQNVNTQYIPTGVNFTPAQFQAAQLQALNTQAPVQNVASTFAAPQFQNTNLAGIQLAAPNFAREQALQQNVMQGFGSQANLAPAINPQAQVEALMALQERQKMQNIADLRARFGASGGQAFGTAAAFAEGNARAAIDAENAARLAAFQQQQDSLMLQQRGQDLQDFLSSRGLDINQLGLASQQAMTLGQQGIEQRGQDINANLQSQAQNNQALLGLNAQNLQQNLAGNQFGLDAAQIGSGQQLQAALANQQAALQGFGLGNDAVTRMNDAMLQQASMQNQSGQFNADAALRAALANVQNQQFGANLNQQGQLANQSAGLQAAGLNQQGNQINNQALMQLLGLQSDAANQYNQLGLQQALASNQFNQNNAQFGANLNQQAQQFDINALLQNQQLGNQWNSQLLNTGVNLQGQQLQAQLAALQQLFAGLGQTQALGTPQSTLQYTPGWGSQVINGIGTLAGAYRDVMGGR